MMDIAPAARLPAEIFTETPATAANRYLLFSRPASPPPSSFFRSITLKAFIFATEIFETYYRHFPPSSSLRYLAVFTSYFISRFRLSSPFHFVCRPDEMLSERDASATAPLSLLRC